MLFLHRTLLVHQPWFLPFMVIWAITSLLLIINFEKFCAWLLRRREKRRLKQLAQRFPETAAKLDPDKIEEENALEQEQRDREEFERLAKEHPEWLK